MTQKIICIVLFIFVSCKKQDTYNVTYEDIKNLNGYWEIAYVVLPDGTQKQYNFNKSIDFFEIKDSLGIRKKVQPQLNGNFIVTNDSEVFSLKTENDSIRMYYRTKITSWKETLISSKENEMSILNESGNLYFYKRYSKIQL